MKQGLCWKKTYCQILLVEWEMIVFHISFYPSWQIPSVNKDQHSHIIIQFQRFIPNHVKALQNATLTRHYYWFFLLKQEKEEIGYVTLLMCLKSTQISSHCMKNSSRKTSQIPRFLHLSCSRSSQFQCVMHNLIIMTVRIFPHLPQALYTQINKLGILLFPTDVVFAANTQESETQNRFIMEVNWYPILPSQSRPLARNRC